MAVKKGELAKRKRGKGEGTIYQRKDETWAAQVTIGINSATGKPIRKTFYGKTRPEVAKKLTQTLSKLENGTLETAKNETLNDWFNEWIEGRKHALEESTYRSYKRIFRCHIQSFIGYAKIKNLQIRDIQNLVNNIQEKSNLSPSSVKKTYSILNVCLESAVNRGYISKNPCKLVELPKNKRKEMHTLKKESLPVFLNAVKKSRFCVAYQLELSTGLRRGELLGLRWKDINLESGIITVNQQLTPEKKIKGLKTDSSYRTINIYGEIIETLKSHKAKQNKNRLLLGEAYNVDDDLVFCNEDGGRINPRYFLENYKTILVRSGLDASLRFHDLRHTFTTLALNAGIPVKTIQGMLGHSSASTTLEIYAHVTNEMQKNAAETISNLLAVNKQ